jgi:hypothetical protein
MTDAELHKIAKKTAIYGVHSGGEYIYSFYIEPLRAFAKLVAEHEREACAKLCDELDQKLWEDMGEAMSGYSEAIRERT